MSDARSEAERVERIARAFHEAYEELAPTYDYTTREASRKRWEDVPHNNRALMLATVGTLLSRGIISVPSVCRHRPPSWVTPSGECFVCWCEDEVERLRERAELASTERANDGF